MSKIQYSTYLVSLIAFYFVSLKSAEAGVVYYEPPHTHQHDPHRPVVPQTSYYHNKYPTSPCGDRCDHQHPQYQVTVVEQYNKRFVDGTYEHRYVLSDGTTQHERSFWTFINKAKVMTRKGYYSHPLPNGQFFTLFYTADENGFHDHSFYSHNRPKLPSSYGKNLVDSASTNLKDN